MVFSSIIFLWVLFPIILIAYYICPYLKVRNLLLVIFSLFFYAWGEPRYIVLMMISVLINYGFGILMETNEKQKELLLALCITMNLLLLGYFKYFNFLAEIWNGFIKLDAFQLVTVSVSLPIGISFYTFQALSYVVDVYRKDNRAQKNFLNMILYISFFPQLIAGPIVKYHDIEQQIEKRSVSVNAFSYGIKRFILGLGKKVILANTFAQVVDKVYEYQPYDVALPLLWMTAILYMLQIYYDFSGYSDMAIGLGRMFGFTFQENFDLPYTAVSIREFWRKWHISLSSWFREYVYIPLGGNRKGKIRTYINLVAVFFLTGVWHGAGWTFIVWGIYHGFFNILERCILKEWIKRAEWKIVGHIYTFLVVLLGWILFRAPTLSYGLQYIGGMFTLHEGILRIERFLDIKTMIFLTIGILGCGIVQNILRRKGKSIAANGDVSLPGMAGYMAVMWFSIILLINNTYNPFIYFRF